MTTMALTRHAEERARQRGLRESDIEFILRYGTDTGDGVLFTNKDADLIIATCKRLICMVGRLRNKRVVTTGEMVVSVYEANRKKQRKLLRHL